MSSTTRENISIILSAEDKATAKIRAVTADVKQQVGVVRDVGTKAKASTELVGTMAASLGGSGIGGFAGEIAMLTERVSAFSEVAKGGGKGALAFKAGLVGVVGVIGFKIGNALGDLVFQTKKWNKELEASNQLALELSAKGISQLSSRWADMRERNGFIFDPEKQKQGLEKMVTEVESELLSMGATVDRLKKKTLEYGESWGSMVGAGKALNDLDKAALKEAKNKVKALEEVRANLTKNNTEAAKSKALEKRRFGEQGFIKTLQLENELLGKSERQIALIQAGRQVASVDYLKQAQAEINKKFDFMDAEKLAADNKKQLDDEELKRIKAKSDAEAKAAKAVKAAFDKEIKELQSRADSIGSASGSSTSFGPSKDDRFGSGRQERLALNRDAQDQRDQNARRDSLLERMANRMDDEARRLAKLNTTTLTVVGD